MILNQHQNRGFIYYEKFIDQLETSLYKRLNLLKRLRPDCPDILFDPLAIRTMPFGQTIKPCEKFKVKVYFTGHSVEENIMEAVPVLPKEINLIYGSLPVKVNLSSGLTKMMPLWNLNLRLLPNYRANIS
jgi:hypothetical protein